ncbi:MAG: pentapeptide repeat-containing protein [Sandaracinaceae bacterium]|nr:pentapeptide repeat-containing protein [Sandaracinaceae bacterium]
MSTLEHLLHENDLEGEDFTALEAQGLDLGGKELYRCTLRGSKLFETRWRRTRLEDCVLEDCDLTRADPAGLVLSGVTLRRCKLLGIDFTDLAANPDVRFEECNLEYAVFRRTNLRKLKILDSNLRATSFVECDLVEADLSGCDLTGAIFEGSSLGKADLGRAQGAFVDPQRNRVKELRISVESAVLLAESLGMRVAGHESTRPRAARTKRR